MKHLLWMAVLGLTACSSGKSELPGERTGAGTDSSLEISYRLGHNQHRFLANARADSIVAKTFLDRHLLKESALEQNGYIHLIEKISAFMATANRQPADPSQPCRTPYVVKLRIGDNTRVANGCRSNPEGSALSRIAREAEFLIHSSSRHAAEGR